MKTNRRDLVKKGMGFIAVSSLVSVVPAFAARRKKKADAAGAELVEPGSGMAANVNYEHDKAKITDASLKKSKNGVEYKDQYCDNCVLYTATKDGRGKCTLFPAKEVMAKGWCTTWSKKA